MTMIAVYVLVKDGTWVSAGHNNGGYEVDQVVALGPEITDRYMKALERIDPETESYFWGGLVEGGALIDMDAQRLLVFSPMLDASQRAAFLDVLTRTWPGWHIGWAYRDAWDFYDHPAVNPPAKPAHVPPTLLEDTRLTATGDYLAPITVVDSDGVRAYKMSLEEGEPWLVGPRILDLLCDDLRGTTLPASPLCGMHIDVPAKTVGVWTVETWTGLEEEWPNLWPGWSLELWDDRSTEQVNRAIGTLTLPNIEIERELRAYGERLDDLWLQGEHELVHLPEDEYRRLRLQAIGS